MSYSTYDTNDGSISRTTMRLPGNATKARHEFLVNTDTTGCKVQRIDVSENGKKDQ